MFSRGGVNTSADSVATLAILTPTPFSLLLPCESSASDSIK